jgi:hypothetical protein
MQIGFKLFVQENRVLFKASMCSLGELDKKQIISKFQRLEILNQMVAKEKTHLFILICLLFISIKLKISSSKHMSYVYL